MKNKRTVIIGIVLIAMLSVSLVMAEQDVTPKPSFSLLDWIRYIVGPFTVVGDARGCDTTPTWTGTILQGSSFNKDASDYCSSDYGLWDVWLGSYGSPYKEYKDTINILCSSSDCIIELYCCDEDECWSNDDCPDGSCNQVSCAPWDAGYKCSGLGGILENTMPYSESSYSYCESADTIDCYYNIEGNSYCTKRVYTGTTCPDEYNKRRLYEDISDCEDNIDNQCAGYDEDDCMAKEECVTGWYDCIEEADASCSDINADSFGSWSQSEICESVSGCVVKSGTTDECIAGSSGGCIKVSSILTQSVSSCAYQGSTLYDSSSLPKSITSSSTEENYYWVFGQCLSNPTSKADSSGVLTQGMIGKGQTKTIPLSEANAFAYVYHFECDPSQVCSFIGGSCTTESDCCDGDIPQISCTNGKCTWDDATCGNHGGIILTGSGWVCDEEYDDDEPNTICCTGNYYNVNGGVVTGGLSLTWTEFYSFSDEDYAKKGVTCVSVSQCPSRKDYEVVCDKTDALTDRISRMIYEACDEDLGWVNEITDLVGNILLLGFGESDPCQIAQDDFDNAVRQDDAGVCIAESKTWYGGLWEQALKIVGGLGLPEQYVMIATIGLLLIIGSIIVNLFKK